jgi:hypothetical protein
MPVVNPNAMENWRQVVSIELRAVSRPWDRAHVNHPSDVVRLQPTNEVLDRPRRMTDREDDEG